MQKIFHYVLTSKRKRRCIALSAALWLLRLLRDIEKSELCRNSDLLDSFNSETYALSRREYNAVEEKYLSCEHALDILESAIEDIDFAY